MAWWFGRKGAPEPVRAFVPAWLSASGGEGLARSYEAQLKSTGSLAVYRTVGWEVGVVRASRIIVDGRQVVGAQTGPIADPAGGTAVDLEARSAITEILSALRQHGLISG